MPVGFQAYATDGTVQVDGTDGGFNMVLLAKGTVTHAGPGATGATGTISGLPNSGMPLMVAIRSPGYATVRSNNPTGFRYHLGQGTTSMDWWAYGRPVVAIYAGLEVYNPAGQIVFNIGNPPLAPHSIIELPTSMPTSGSDLSTVNTTVPISVAVPANCSFLFSDTGVMADHYRGYPFTSSPSWNERFVVASQWTGSTLNIAGIRQKVNRGSLHTGMNFQTQYGRPPSRIMCVNIPPT